MDDEFNAKFGDSAKTRFPNPSILKPHMGFLSEYNPIWTVI